MTESFVVRRETHIAAPRATVFAFLTDPDKIVQWMGTEATTEVHPGGMYLLKGVGSATARGTFREVVPVHRLAYSFGWEGNEEVPPGSSLIEIDLIEQDGGTLLRMTHSGLPNAATQASHGKGWAHYLGRLTESPPATIPAPIGGRMARATRREDGYGQGVHRRAIKPSAAPLRGDGGGFPFPAACRAQSPIDCW